MKYALHKKDNGRAVETFWGILCKKCGFWLEGEDLTEGHLPLRVK